MLERNGGSGDDDDIISNNIIGMCVVVPGGNSHLNEKGPYEPEIFPDLVLFWGYFVDLCYFSTGDTFFYKTDWCIFRGKCGVFYRRLFPDFNCIIADIHCIRTVRTNPDIGTNAGDFRKACSRFGKESGAAGA